MPAKHERAITLCNGGLMGVCRPARRWRSWSRSAATIARSEFYLTDAVAIARDWDCKTVALEVMEDEVSGINSKAQLAAAEGQIQQRLRQAALDAGVTLVAPETVFLAADTKLGRDVMIEPYVVFGPGVTVEDGATIRSFSHIYGAHVGKDAIVGPYARLRPGAKLGEKVHIGNFVEVKEATLEAGAKANHLAYIGDARVGEGANIGAGTITCNYDGVGQAPAPTSARAPSSARTRRWWRRSRSATAPMSGRGRSSPRTCRPTRWRLERAQQTVKEGWAKRLRSLKSAGKK